MSQFTDEELAAYVGQFWNSPLRFVENMFPWGEAGTPLEKEEGPDEWQRQVMLDIEEHINEDPIAAIREAVRSGHGIGKSALVSWLILWFMSTRPHPQVVVTANTQTQLKTKTWRELSKWHNMLANRHWFTWTATSFYMTEHPETWAAHAIPWSANNPEAFAGTHDENVLVVFDEASGIDKCIWETSEGAMTTPGAIWCAFGNPTRNAGAFYDCFNKFKHRWSGHAVDARYAKMTNKKQLEEWIEDYGLESDFVRVRVLGEFPIAGSHQLIPRDIVEAAMSTVLPEEVYEDSPLVLGVDVARSGEDESVLYLRRGRKHYTPIAYLGSDLMQLAQIVADTIDAWCPVVTCIDGGGVGGGVVDRLRQLGYEVVEVNFGATSTLREPDKYVNMRAECWDYMRKHIADGCEMPDDPDLREQLIAQEFFYEERENRMQLVSKRDMKKIGLPSPDRADALAMTFAVNVASSVGRKRKRGRKRASWRVV